MQLQNQIESMNNPQEFTRLYNAVLSIEHGDDYLAIDDDQADGGNDGYLKSEKRIFAGHCFKRVKKQKINQEVLAKMSSDLSKAILLRDNGVWDIAAWTFLCNYPISEEVGAVIFRQGVEANMDVSWHSSDYFAAALQKYQDVSEQFPNLIATNIQAKLDVILEKLKKPEEDRTPITQVPDNTLDQERLLLEKPACWEYLYFASVLSLGKDSLELKWRDHNMHHSRPSGVIFTQEAAITHFKGVLSQLTKITSSINVAFESNNKEQAFGRPGESGDPVLIKHLAAHVVNAYEDTLGWAYRLRAASFPDSFKDVAETCARIADRPAADIRAFIDDCVEKTNQIHPHLTNPKNDKPLVLEMSLILTVDEQACARFVDEFKKSKQRS